jgi:2,4-dienoyl-CoA reductase-like NADH-dependent reductase (Old Yellow Enzyme family)/thioredoxin reductase
MYDHLLRPLALGPVTLKNRVMQVATSTNFAEPGVGPRLRAFLEERAKGGIGSVVVGALAIQTGAVRISALDEDHLSGLADLAKTLHAYDMVVLGQLVHGGRQHLADAPPELVGPSAIACPYSGGTPHSLDTDEIRSLIRMFVRGAVNLQAAGFDGAEVHGAQGHLVQQFLSPFSNQRTDEYGGSLENRTRFALEILEGIRAACGSGFVLGIRMSVEEFSEGGLHIEQSKKICSLMVTSGTLDYLSVSQSNFDSISAHIPDRTYPFAPFVNFAAEIRAVVAPLPVVASGRIIDPERADRIVAEGRADIVGLSRPLIADPQWLQKAASGRADQIRRCVSCNQCWGWVSGGGQIGCIHNAAAGNELTWGSGTMGRIAAAMHIVVVGGGPAGMEAARVAAERGHRVTLLEARDRLGGSVIDASNVPGESELRWVVDHLVGAVHRAGVEVVLNSEATDERVLELRPDTVVIATGSQPAADDVPDSGDVEVLCYPYVIDAGARVWDEAVVLDDDGHYIGIAAAHEMALRGTHVSLVTRFFEVGREIPAASRITALRTLDKLGVRLLPTMWLRRVEGRNVVLEHYLNRDREISIPNVDAIVRAGRRIPDDRLFRQVRRRLAERGVAVHLVGDARQPRRIANAIHDGHAIGRMV